jgi:triosephosphate isomerase
MRKKILAANWKMNLTQPEQNAWLQSFKGFNWHSEEAEVRIYPSSIYLKDFKDTSSHIGAQNVYFESGGAFTGELSIAQLKSIGASSVLIGHSERRQIFVETDDVITHKLQACAAQEFPFVLCCGETLQTREANAQLSYVFEQLSQNLHGYPDSQVHLMVVAYEPIWAIGRGLSASIEQIAQMHEAIRSQLHAQFGARGGQIPILYGGSVTPQNAEAIFGCPNVDGALVGGASLDPQLFYQLWQALHS